MGEAGAPPVGAVGVVEPVAGVEGLTMVGGAAGASPLSSMMLKFRRPITR